MTPTLSKLSGSLIVFLLMLLFFVACAPVTQVVSTPVVPSKTATSKPATLTPIPTVTDTATATPKLPLPGGEIPSTPTPGAGVITTKNIENLEVLDIFGNGKVHGTKWSPNGRFLALDTSLGWRIYNAETFQPLKFASDSNNTGLEWSLDGKFLAMLEQYTDEIQPVYLFNGEALEPIKVLRTAEYFAWSPGGNMLALMDSAHIYLYDPHSLKQISVINTTEYPGAVRFSPDEKTIATLNKGQVRLWDAATGKLILTLKDAAKENDYISRFEFSSDGENLLVFAMINDFEYKVSILNSTTGQVTYTYQKNLQYSRSANAIFSPDGQQMALQTYDTLRFIDVHSGNLLKTISLGYDDSAVIWRFNLAYSRDGKKLITTAGIFDVQTGERLDDGAFASFEPDAQGGLLAAVPYKNDPPVILLWDVEKNQKIRSMPNVDIDLYPISISADEKKILTFDAFGNVLIDEIATGKQLAQIEFDSRVSSVAFGPKTSFSSGYILAIGQENGKIQVWDTGKHQIIHTFFADAGAGMANPVAISPNGQLLAYHALGGGMEIADIFSGSVLRNLACVDDDWINHLVFSPDGQMLLAGSENTRSLFWGDINDGDSLKRADVASSYDFDFSLNENQLIWTDNSSIYLWDMTTKKITIALTKENPAEYDGYSVAALSTDGRLLVVGTLTGLIDIWDVENRQILRTITSDQGIPGYDGGADDTIKRLVFSPYNHVFVSFGADSSVHAWDADTGLSLPFWSAGVFAFSPDGSLLAHGYDEVYLTGFPTVQK